jgi:MFS transporter, OFA family, oxalate/formate antiporter
MLGFSLGLKTNEMKNTFYGWILLFGLFLMYAATNGIGMYALSVMRPMQTQAFRLDPKSAAALPSILFLTVAIISPFVGALLDRFNPRLLISIGAISVILLAFAQQFITNYGGLVIFYMLYALAMSFAGIISFMFLLNRWFRKYIGLAAGILVVGSSLGGIIFPRIVAMSGDWQTACIWLAGVGTFFILPPLFFIRNKPSDMGLQPDGAQNTEGVGDKILFAEFAIASTESIDNQGITLTQALKTPSFYMVLITTGVLWFCINGYIQNHGFFMADLGKDKAASASVLGIFSMMAILGKLLFGYLSDKFPHRFIMILSIGLMALSTFVLKTAMSNQSYLIPFALIFGVGFGGAFTIIQVWVADIYGGKSYGSILGVVTMIDTLAGSAGMILLGSMRKASGSYTSGFDLLLMLCFVAMGCTFLVRKPKIASTI